LDGAVVNVSVRAQKGWLYLAVSDPARFEVYETSVRRDAADKLFAYIHEVRVALGQSQQGLGLRAFIRQVAGAQAMELAYFKLWAAGNRLDTARNGYYTWARFGFDAPLSGYHRRLLTNSLRGARTVNEVIERGGSRWWWFNGDDTEMYFDLLNRAQCCVSSTLI
jgi:hypothetical protein